MPSRATRLLPWVLPIAAVIACTDETVEPPQQPTTAFRGAHANGLVLHWTFQDRDGNQVFDLSGHGHHATLNGGSFVSSAWGEAVSLDGVDDYLSFTGPRDPDEYGFGGEEGEFTIHARVKVSDVDKNNILCTGCAPLSHISVGSPNVDERVVTAMYDDDTGNKAFSQSTASLVDDTWVNVTIVVDGGVGTDYYLDCEFDRSHPDTSIRLHDYNYSAIGDAGNPANWYGGQIDDLRVWSRALSSTEIEDLCTEPVEAPCDGDPLAATLGITLPTPPASSYTLPGSYVEVSNTADLVAKAGDAVNYPIIVLDDAGTFTTTGLGTNNWVTINGQEIWAETPGAVTLPYAISAGYTTTGSEIHGVVFDIEDEDYAYPVGSSPNIYYTAIVNWGAAEDMVIEDVVIHGNGVLDRGMYIREPDGLVIGRVEIDGVKQYGILADRNEFTESYDNPMDIHDVRLYDIADPEVDARGCGIAVGHEATISNIHIRDVRWCGITTHGMTTDAVISNVDIDRIGIGATTGSVGVYVERETFDLTVRNFCIGPNTRVGINSEWDHYNDPDPLVWEGTRGTNTVVEDGLIEAWLVGVHFDQGTRNGHVEDVVFRNYDKSAIIYHNNLTSSATWPNYDDGSTQTSNTFELAEGVCCDTTCNLSRVVWNSTPSCEGCTPGGGC